MIRSLYSGVAGMKSQQTKMDVIGNNIANVGTYGFKSDRATFQDVYYQTTSAATQATGNIGGTNAKQVGYGNSVSSIDTNVNTSAMTATGYSLDVAIAGEGFLQVMGADGNIMYTKAGMLDIDADGNLVDVNGYFVLGVSGDSKNAPASSEKINIALPYLDPNNAEVTEKINNVSYTVSASNYTNKGNVNFSFSSSAALPVGQKMEVTVSGTSINVKLNSNEYFKSMDDFNSYLNQAITDALGGTQHPAGTFTITSSDESMFRESPLGSDGMPVGLTGAEIVGNNFGYALGDSAYISNGDTFNQASSNVLKNLFSISSVNSGFQGDTRVNALKLDDDGLKDDEEDNPANFSIEFGTDGIKIIVSSQNSVNPVTGMDGESATYVAEVSYSKLSAPGEVILRRVDTSNISEEDQEALVEAREKLNLAKEFQIAEKSYNAANDANTKAKNKVTDAEAALSSAEANRNTAQTNATNANTALTDAKNKLTDAETNYSTLGGDAAYASAQADYNTVTAAGSETLAAKEAYDAAKAADDAGSTEETQAALAAAAADANYVAYKGAVDALDKFVAAIDALDSAKDGVTDATATLANAMETANKAQSAYNSANNNLTAAKNNAEIAEKTLESAMDNYNTLKLAVGAADGDTAESILAQAQSDYDLAQSKVAISNAAYTGDETDSLVMNYPELTSIKNAMQQLGMDYEQINDIISGVKTDAVTFDCGDILKLRHTEETRELGFGQKAFTLKGGTEGGEQSVANLTAISVGQDGVIVGVHDIWGVMELGRIDLATFANPAGLTKVGSTYFDESLNSGDPIVVNAGTEGTGNIMASTLESSNVDLSSEFTDMIVTQRGFQASSRVITVSDSMLEELINLKR